MKRICPKTGEIFLPHRYKDGMFKVADPRHGQERHLKKNAILVATETEALDYVKKGYLLRMRGKDTGEINLIVAAEIRT